MSPRIADVKERVNIYDLWHEFGYEGVPKASCSCPWHNDRNSSFSVYDNGRRFKCFAGCGEGDVVDFYAAAKGIPNDESCRELLKRAGGYQEPIRWARPRQEQPKPKPARITLPPAEPYTDEVAQLVADSRGLKPSAVEHGVRFLGTVSVGDVHGERSWIVSDASGKCAEGRRIDRKPFPAIGTLGERKAHTLPGSSKSWPVGLLPPAHEERWVRKVMRRIILVEGTPDYLAACQLVAAWGANILPIAMLGATQDISEDALPYFKGREVMILAHPDEPGRDAAVRWRKQIRATGASVQAIQLEGDDLCGLVAGGLTHDELQRF